MMFALKLPFWFSTIRTPLHNRDRTFDGEERWIMVGAIGPGSILLVVHTFYEEH
jgi:uncharacterized DUF497 family protein